MTRLLEYARLMRLDRPIGFWLLLWPALWALWISADGQPGERVFAIFVAGTFLMRAAGCVINDYADRRIDPHVRRTAARPLARGAVSPAEALGLFVVLACAALLLIVPLAPLTRLFALAGGALAVIYPFLKRFFPLPAGLARRRVLVVGADGVCRAGRRRSRLRVAAVRGGGALDRGLRHDVRDGRPRGRSRASACVLSAILFGRADRIVVALLQLGSLALLAVVGQLSALGRWYWLGLAVAARSCRCGSSGSSAIASRPRASARSSTTTISAWPCSQVSRSTYLFR